MSWRKEVLRKILFWILDNENVLDLYKIFDVKIKNVIESKQKMECDQDFYNNGLSSEQLEENSNAVVLSFVGELMLLRYQLCAGWNGKEFDYSDLFKYTKDIFKGCNYNIGILEGPVCKGEFSNGDFLDGSDLRLNYPYVFLENIKKAGIDFVSIANNHMYDMGAEGAYQTVENLKRAGLDYSGLFRSSQERDAVKTINIDGIEIAILTYMDGQNKIPKEYFINGKQRYESALIVPKNDKSFKKIKKEVEMDFIRAKKANPDLIIVIPHMGELGSFHTSKMQKVWNDIFVENGADIILTASSHSVQPIEWKKRGLKSSVIINSPGNYVNSRTSDDNDDASAIVKIFIDKKTKSVKMCSIIPMYAKATMDKLFVPIPIYKINSDLSIRKSFSVYDYKRIEKVQKFITRSMLGITYPMEAAFREYFMSSSGNTYFDKELIKKRLTINSTDDDRNRLGRFFKTYSSVLFIGDSITHGTKNGGIGWFEPLCTKYRFTYSMYAREDATSKQMFYEIKNEKKLWLDPGLYVIALGTNDIRYRNNNICAMDAKEYVYFISEIVKIVQRDQKKIVIVIAPWISLDKDVLCMCGEKEKKKLFTEYSVALEQLESDTVWIINPNDYIANATKRIETVLIYMDYINPTPLRGVELYSNAFLDQLLQHKNFNKWEKTQ